MEVITIILLGLVCFGLLLVIFIVSKNNISKRQERADFDCLLGKNNNDDELSSKESDRLINK